MDIREITKRFYAAPQLNPEDMMALASAGFTTVICNRPDAEVPPSHQAQAMQDAARSAGLDFHFLPLTHDTFTAENIAKQRSISDAASGACVAYCASGTRSTFAWAMAQAGEMPTDDIVRLAAQAGYDLSPLLQTLDALATQTKA
ncbi:MAG: TIGR01244 family sulfur transferase [Pseudomonadota bacterium]